VRTRHLVLILVTLIIIATQTGCRAAQAQEPVEQSFAGNSSAHIADKTDVHTCVYQVRPEMTDIKLKMNVRLTNGVMAWVLLDPSGQVRWNGKAPGWRRIAKSRRFEPMEGEWKLKLAMADASGEYEALWYAE